MLRRGFARAALNPAQSFGPRNDNRKWWANHVGAGCAFDLQNLSDTIHGSDGFPFWMCGQIGDESIVDPYRVKGILAEAADGEAHNIPVLGSPCDIDYLRLTPLADANNEQGEGVFPLKLLRVGGGIIHESPFHAALQRGFNVPNYRINRVFETSRPCECGRNTSRCAEVGGSISKLPTHPHCNSLVDDKFAHRAARINLAVRSDIGRCGSCHRNRRSRVQIRAATKQVECDPKYVRTKYRYHFGKYVTQDRLVIDLANGTAIVKRQRRA